MALENDESQLEQQGESAPADASAGGGDAAGDDLTGALAEQEGAFVGETKKSSSLGVGTLIMGGFLLACGAGTYLMYTRHSNANVAPTPEAAAAQTTITQFLSDDKSSANRVQDLLQNTEKAVEQFRASPGKVQIPVGDLQTNPFRLAADGNAAPSDDVDTVAAEKRAAEDRAKTLKSAQSLSLQFIMSGKRKGCMINNTVYREGETIGDFTIDTISPDAVVIRKGEARFELRMKKK
jgi:hypothetical protein